MIAVIFACALFSQSGSQEDFPLLGTWRILVEEQNGKRVSTPAHLEKKLIITRDRFVLMQARTVELEFFLEQPPKGIKGNIDLFLKGFERVGIDFEKGETKITVQKDPGLIIARKGIYSLKEGELTLCLTSLNQKKRLFPQNGFDTKGIPEAILFSLKKAN